MTQQKHYYIYLPDLVNLLEKGEELPYKYYYVEATMEKPKCKKYWDPKEHLKLFANTFIIECAIKNLYDLVFEDPYQHYYLHEGRGINKSDLMDTEFHTPIEAKMFQKKEKFEAWLKGKGFDANHDAEFVLVYVVEENLVYVVETKYKTYRLAYKQFEKPVDLIK